MEDEHRSLAGRSSPRWDTTIRSTASSRAPRARGDRGRMQATGREPSLTAATDDFAAMLDREGARHERSARPRRPPRRCVPARPARQTSPELISSLLAAAVDGAPAATWRSPISALRRTAASHFASSASQSGSRASSTMLEDAAFARGSTPAGARQPRRARRSTRRWRAKIESFWLAPVAPQHADHGSSTRTSTT